MLRQNFPNAGPVRSAIRFACTLLVSAGLVSGFAFRADAADLTIELTGVRSAEGDLYVAVHAPTAGVKFPDSEGVVKRKRMAAQAGNVSFVIPDLPEGNYAIATFHDENGNGELDTNLFGVPTEGYGFSNDAPSRFGPAEFEAASFAVDKPAVIATVAITY